MQLVIVTVRRHGTLQAIDLELPAEVKSSVLLNMLSIALDWVGETDGYELLAEPPGRVLSADETLADAGIQDGAYLTIQPAGLGPPALVEPVVRADPGEGPVTGWRDLGLALAHHTSAEVETLTESEDEAEWAELD